MTGVTPVCAENGSHRAGRILGGGCLAVAAAVIAACGTVPAPGQGGSHGGQGGAGTLSAARAVALAGQSARRIRSMAMTETMVMKGVPPGAFGAGFPGTGGTTRGPGTARAVFTVRMKMQLKPVLRMQMSMRAGMGSHGFAMEEILTAGAMYIKAPGMLPANGKPWAEVKLSDLPSGLKPGMIVRKMQKSDPLAGLSGPAAQARLLAAAAHLRVVRGQVVDGVQATEYAGTLAMRKFLAMMPIASPQALRSAPQALRQANLPFRIWIDAKHQLRKLVITLRFRGASMQVTVNITAINKPVRITPPPASEVSAAPVP